MPIYEYQCQECGSVFEEMLKEFDVLEYPCPKCKGIGKRLISRPTLQFKGMGWTCHDGPPNKNWGKPSAAEDPYHNPGLPLEEVKRPKDEKPAAAEKSAE
ncbi:MAG: zinc ribbon domain-containing protein [Desulfovibrionaceae bacterium]|nr:zinc ribbon domain-containing protein [Desulfovibrionaceae bacterium]